MFGKYQVIAFKDGEHTPRSFSVNSVALIVLFIFFLILTSTSFIFWGSLYKTVSLEKKLKQKETLIEAQQERIVSIIGQVQELQTTIERVQQFDSQIRAMTNLQVRPTSDNTSMGGVSSSEFSSTYLPLHKQELLTKKIQNFLRQLEANVRLEEVRQQDLMHSLADQKDLTASTPSSWPVKGRVSSRFGIRPSPFGTSAADFHRGLDIAAPQGTPIKAPAKGVVVFVGRDGGYGNVVFIKHRAGITTRYAHMREYAVKKGQKINKGDIIGRVGNTGRSTGAHLHYEVRVGGVSVNPMRYIIN
ncbi:MAG: M23 family metallopeptidase [Desulfovibrionaceae bacterium]